MRHRLIHSPREDPHEDGSHHDGPLPSHTTTRSIKNASLVFQRNALVVICLFLCVGLLLSNREAPSWLPTRSSLRNKGQCEIFLGSYRGPLYNSPESGTIGRPKCLLESKWLRVSQHNVKFPGSDTVFDDWMWVDYHDRINLLVENEKIEGEEKQFLVFQQKKYALEGRNSLAIIGGIIEPGETAQEAARRELDEEMNGLQCAKLSFLGRYRTDVNRGMGWVNSFVATQCEWDSGEKKHKVLPDEVGAPDTEKMVLKSLAISELQKAVSNGDFIEVQWTATVALALLHHDLWQ